MSNPEVQKLQLSPKDCRAMLKVLLYTSLNGGNPFSPDRVLDNLGGVKPELIVRVAEQGEEFDKSVEFKLFLDIFGRNPLVEEVKLLNHQCYDRWGKKVYTIDRIEPYEIHSKHLGISRVLQSFEVVLLTELVRHCLDKQILPLSLDHDGLLGLMQGGLAVSDVGHLLTEQMKPWSTYLLGRNLEVVPKRAAYQGEDLVL